jgi:hypothetical protein
MHAVLFFGRNEKIGLFLVYQAGRQTDRQTGRQEEPRLIRFAEASSLGSLVTLNTRLDASIIY